MRGKLTYIRNSKIRELLYLEDIKRASKLTPEVKLKEALELSNFCLKLNKVSKNGKSKTDTDECQ